ncbi:hypothetical protein [Halobacillus mangrovi]|uniref:SLH domain-containing protein n=1 Tax=Halobacillus mangrovi TaxID=402384 RepID=A0A1W5ZR14_9BACI|nr:hypothetical protein [Halobacillus mangrovi]ARI75722.1 hypothetical protein HM131_02260 [Halobacillus mangrovi]
MNRLRKLIIVAATVLLAGASISYSPHVSHAESHKEDRYRHLDEHLDFKYPLPIMFGVIMTLKKEHKYDLSLSEAIDILHSMKKVEVMDSYLDFRKHKVESKEIRRIVKQVYDIDLERVSELGAGKQVSTYPKEITDGVKLKLADESIEDLDAYIQSLTKVEVMDLYLEHYGKKIDGPEIRRVVNQIFGVNLDGISSLEGSGVSLFSKDQWISQYDNDLFVVHTGLTDVDVWVYPTEYFIEKTGRTELPIGLQNGLKALGFEYSEEKDALYYANPTGESVPDQFKGHTLGTIIGFIKSNYADLLKPNSDHKNHESKDVD